MKIPEEYEVKEYTQAISVGALKGAAVGAVVSLGLFATLKRRTNFFQQAGGFHKTLIMIAPTIFCAVTTMEYASRDFEEHQRDKKFGIKPQNEPHKSQSTYKTITDFAYNNQYKLVVAGWAASLAGSFYIVNRDKYMTRSQKIVQARVYAQGATVALLLLSVLLSVRNNTPEKEEQMHHAAQDSWQKDLKYVRHEK